MHRLLDLRTSAEPLAVARAITGANAALAAWEAWRLLPRLLAPDVVRIPLLPWVPHLPSTAVPIFIALWLLAALAFLLGWKTRTAGAVLTFVTGYTLHMDQQAYSNHLYLLAVILLLLTIADSGAAWSLDARGDARKKVAAWPILLLKVQVTIVYFFSAASKITPQYLAGDVLGASLKGSAAPAILTVLAVTSILAELFIAFGLWSPRLRPFALAAGVGLHLLILAVLDSSRLSLLIFALSMFAVYVLFAGSSQCMCSRFASRRNGRAR